MNKYGKYLIISSLLVLAFLMWMAMPKDCTKSKNGNVPRHCVEN